MGQNMELFVLYAGLLQFLWLLRFTGIDCRCSLVIVTHSCHPTVSPGCSCRHVQRQHMLVLYPHNLLSSRLNTQRGHSPLSIRMEACSGLFMPGSRPPLHNPPPLCHLFFSFFPTMRLSPGLFLSASPTTVR